MLMSPLSSFIHKDGFGFVLSSRIMQWTVHQTYFMVVKDQLWTVTDFEYSDNDLP